MNKRSHWQSNLLWHLPDLDLRPEEPRFERVARIPLWWRLSLGQSLELVREPEVFKQVLRQIEKMKRYEKVCQNSDVKCEKELYWIRNFLKYEIVDFDFVSRDIIILKPYNLFKNATACARGPSTWPTHCAWTLQNILPAFDITVLVPYNSYEMA